MISDYQIKCATGFKNFGDLFDGNFGTELGGIEKMEFIDGEESLDMESVYTIHDYRTELFEELDYFESSHMNPKDAFIEQMQIYKELDFLKCVLG